MLLKLKTLVVYFLILVYLSGVIGIILQPNFFLPFTPFTLILTTFVFLLFQPVNKSSYMFGFLCIVLAGFTAEIIGVKTGLIFGEYSYGKNLGAKLYEVPLVISLNWAVLISCGILVGSHVTKNKIVAAVISALVVTLIDFLMEQVVTSLDFWHFNAGIAGVHNYIGWLLISFVASLLLQKHLYAGDKKVAYTILSLQVLFFGTLNIYKFISV